ncbi:uncharacterized protein LOC127967977 isoform X2 [Carassius gibelio]|uniref:uncharacterized protein LOC127967977 isoform X2 n=1 Tax=Carassius gibelio TaxID=101364 RepID=UPI00227771D9|nr:uncharacterized protein LOC127967977 isoform X2 [Carassius gibelio]
MNQGIKDLVISILPSLSDETLAHLLEVLEELGVENKEDLVLVEEKDIEKYLRPIQCRKLLAAFKNEGLPVIQLNLEAVPSPSSSQSPLGSTCSPSSHSSCTESFAPNLGRPWHVDFRVNWERMPSSLQKCLVNQARPLPVDRKNIVQAVVDQILEQDPNPSRATCHTIVRGIIREFPKCFADIGKTGDIIGDGCQSLLQQIKTRVEYKNRNNTLARRRRERRASSGAGTMARGPVDQYGCVRWAPTDLPSGETETTLDEMKMRLRRMFSEDGFNGAERAEPLMEKTYILQRTAPTIDRVIEEWPFLSSRRCLYSHFKLLTDVSIISKLREAIHSKGSTIVKFCQRLSRYPGIAEVLANYDVEVSDKAMCVLQLLRTYFKEPQDAIVLEADPSATAADVQRMTRLPSTPRLIVQGDMIKPAAWLLSIEGKVVMGPHADFITGIASLFSSYYCLNLQYPEESTCTLEFIQRCFLGINPDTGSKSKKKQGGINQQVCSLLRKLVDFEWMAT